MIALVTLWRWRVRLDGTPYVEITNPGERCDWVTEESPYWQLGWVEVAQ